MVIQRPNVESTGLSTVFFKHWLLDVDGHIMP